MCRQSSEVTKFNSQSVRGSVWAVLIGKTGNSAISLVEHNAAPQIPGRKWTLLSGVKGVKEKKCLPSHRHILLILLILGLRQITSGANLLSPTFMPYRPAAPLVSHLVDIATKEQPCTVSERSCLSGKLVFIF